MMERQFELLLTEEILTEKLGIKLGIEDCVGLDTSVTFHSEV